MNLPRQAVGGRKKHLIRHLPGPADDGAKSHTGENINIIALAGYDGLVAKINGIKRTATGKDCPPVTPAISLLRRTFGLGGRI